MADVLRLVGRVFIKGDIRAVTGLHIGGTDPGINIGGVNTIVVDSLTGQPYVPGSSLKGKMRSLLEKYMALPLFEHAGVENMHTADVSSKRNGRNLSEAEASAIYQDSHVAQVFGVPAQTFNTPTRLIVRDVQLQPESALELLDARTELPYSEIKTEVSIDRITSQANPRQVERVPAGAVFGEMVIVYSIFEFYDEFNGEARITRPADHFTRDHDIEMLETVFYGMALLEDDFLGGLGSRGSGQIAFEKLHLTVKTTQQYQNELPLLGTSREQPTSIADTINRFGDLRDELAAAFGG